MDNPYLPKPAKILEIRRETKTEKTFRVSCNDGDSAQCGQFYEFSLPGSGEAPFSVSYIGDGFIETTIRNAGKLSSAMHTLKERDTVYLRGPYGQGFPLEEFSRRELAVIAGGTAAAPVRAIIRRIEESSLEVERLKILLGFRDKDNILFTDEIERWQNEFSCYVSLDYPSKDWPGLSGFVNQHISKLKLKPEARVAVVGPAVMIKFVADQLLEEVISEGNIWVSYERLMQCGIGKCGHCRIESKYVCIDGPVFNYASVKDLID